MYRRGTPIKYWAYLIDRRRITPEYLSTFFVNKQSEVPAEHLAVRDIRSEKWIEFNIYVDL